jgi:hypothetical protein
MRTIAFIASALVVAAALTAAGGRPLPADSGTAAGCVLWQTEARWVGMGYNHLVHLHNTCSEAMRCEVSTDVNPEVTVVHLDPEEKETVTTFMGSPASEFEAYVECTSE